MVVKIKKSFRKFQDRIRSTPLMAIFSQIQNNFFKYIYYSLYGNSKKSSRKWPSFFRTSTRLINYVFIQVIINEFEVGQVIAQLQVLEITVQVADSFEVHLAVTSAHIFCGGVSLVIGVDQQPDRIILELKLIHQNTTDRFVFNAC